MQPDKVLHFAAAALAGAAKEACDATGRGTVDLWDFIATAAGALLPAFYHYSQGQGA